MSPTTDATPLAEWTKAFPGMMSRHQYILTRDIPSTRQRLLDVSEGLCRFRIIGSGHFTEYGEARASVGGLCVRFRRWDCEARCEALFPRAADQKLILQIPLRGQFTITVSQRSVQVIPGQVLLLTAPGDVRRRWQGPSELLTLMLDPECIRHATGPDQAPAFRLLRDRHLDVIDLAKAGILAHAINLAICDLNDEAPSLTQPEIRHTFSTLMAQLLIHGEGRTVAPPAPARRDVAPYYVLRAERYFRENLRSRIGIDQLCRATGVSARTIHYGFKTYRNATPMQYLKVMRLDQACRTLEAGTNARGSVHRIARQVGYTSKSQFARDYRNHFGESPSDTLRRSHRLLPVV